MTTYDELAAGTAAAARVGARPRAVAVAAVDALTLVAAAVLSQAAAIAGGTDGLPGASLLAFVVVVLAVLHTLRRVPETGGAATALAVPAATAAAAGFVAMTAAAGHAGVDVDVARIWLFASLYVVAGRYVLGGISAAGRDARLADALDGAAKRAFDVVTALLLLFLFAPVFAATALAIKLDSPGPVFYRCRRIGRNGRELRMLKFRKMWDGASGLPLTASTDDRFTRVGRVIADFKLDELPQLVNVLRGEMSLVGPRPEDPAFVLADREAFEPILAVRPGITGLCQLAFAKESRILDPEDRIRDYVERLLPQKIHIDQLYASRRTIGLDLRIALWTFAAVVLRRDVAVNRRTGELTIRRRLRPAASHSR